MAQEDMKKPTVFGISAVLKTPKGYAVIEEQEDNPAIGKVAGMLAFPGGFCAPGEHPQDAAVREMLEEAGIVAKAVAIIGFYLINGAFGVVYEMEQVADEVSTETDSDVGVLRFLSSEEILKHDVRPAVKEILRDFDGAERFALDAVVDCR